MNKHTINNIVFAGTPDISANLLKNLINSGYHISACYTQPDNPKGRGQKTLYSPVKNVAVSHNIPVFQPHTLKEQKAVDELKNLNPDLIIVFAYGLIFPKAILTIPKLGCINVHTSLLPRWRGAAPVQHAILAGDHITGISIMMMEASLDTGAVLHSLSCPITTQDTTESLYNKLQALTISSMLEVLDNLNSKLHTATVQDHALASYASKINKLDAKINWQLSAIEIDRQIRAYIPAPIAFTQNNLQSNIRIWQAKILDYSIKNNSPGKILKISKDGIDIATGCGILRLEKLQFPGSKILLAADFLNSPKYKLLFEQDDQLK